MPMQPKALKAKMKTTIYNGLKKEFAPDISKGINYDPIADQYWQKLAEAISGIAADIVTEIVTNAQVSQGIPTAGSPASQITVVPGKIT